MSLNAQVIGTIQEHYAAHKLEPSIVIASEKRFLSLFKAAYMAGETVTKPRTVIRAAKPLGRLSIMSVRPFIVADCSNQKVQLKGYTEQEIAFYTERWMDLDAIDMRWSRVPRIVESAASFVREHYSSVEHALWSTEENRPRIPTAIDHMVTVETPLGLYGTHTVTINEAILEAVANREKAA